MKPSFLIFSLLPLVLFGGAQEIRPHGHPPHQPESQSRHRPTIWHPPLNTSWQWQLTTPVQQKVNAHMYDIDMFDNDASVVASLGCVAWMPNADTPRASICQVQAYQAWTLS